jgi:thiamine-phosphate pyrophosphorylase
MGGKREMNANCVLLAKCDLYVLLDFELLSKLGKRAGDVMLECIDAGVSIFQARYKTARSKEFYNFSFPLAEIAKANNVLFIVNDDIGVALSCGASGVHLGLDDLPVGAARRIAPVDFIIGASANTLQQAFDAERSGAAYIGYGAMFATETKRDTYAGSVAELAEIAKKIEIPVFPLGGIDAGNIEIITGCGLRRACVGSGILGQNSCFASAKKLREILNANREV